MYIQVDIGHYLHVMYMYVSPLIDLSAFHCNSFNILKLQVRHDQV